MERTDLSVVMKGTLDKFRMAASEKGLRFEAHVMDDVFIQGHQGHLSAMVGNLLDNAIRFTEKGSVKVWLIKNGSRARVEVTDTGVGINNVKMAVEPGYQEELPATRRNDGLGIGLSVVEKVAKEHSGEIEFDSSQGHGTSVRVFLPLAK